MARIAVPPPISCGLFLSYRCNSRCRHCIYACSPDWAADWITERNLLTILGQLSTRIEPSPLGRDRVSLNHGLHFTGGEPFLDFNLLLKGVEIARDLGIPSTFVETNCYWCADDQTARDRMTSLKNKGLSGMMISVNPFYLEYVPFDRTERAIRIGQEIFPGNLMVYQVEHYLHFRELGIRGSLPLEKYLGMVGPQYLRGATELFLTGRAAYELKSLYPGRSARHFVKEPCQPPFLRDWHNHIDNYGNYIPGYCAGISLGDASDLERIWSEGIDAESHPVLAFLATGDFEGLLGFASSQFGYREAAGGYVSKCHLCLDIRKHLSREGFRELKPEEFYSHLA